MVMRKTRKWGYVEQEANRLAALGMAPKDIAQRLGLNRSTVQRWMHAGKLHNTVHKPPDAKVEDAMLTSATQMIAAESAAPAKRKRGRPRREAAHTPPRPPQAPEDWAKEIRATYDLDATDDQLVTIAQSQLMVSLDPLTNVQIRLQAQAAFRASVKQLSLSARIPKGEERMVPVAKTGTDSARPRNPVVKRGTGDPRAFLMVVPKPDGTAATVTEPEPVGDHDDPAEQ